MSKVNCLIDTGSQRSYLSGNILKNFNITNLPSSKYLVHSFVDSSYRTFSEISFSIDLRDGGGFFSMPLLIDKDFDLSFKIDGLQTAISNIKSKFRLAPHKHDGDQVRLDGLLGVDAIQFFSQFDLVKCLNGSAFSCESGLIPFGHIDHFLDKNQLDEKYSNETDDACTSTLVNFLVSPVGTFFDPISNSMKDSQVEQNLDNLFSLDSLGLPANSVADDVQISKFEKNIVHKEGKYFIDIPWIPENLAKVPSCFQICKAVLNKVVAKLRSADLYQKYDDVFKQQLCDGILEQVPLDASSKRVFIPHRPVIRSDEQCTTKLRVVLNCSFKLGKLPSLNESAFPGVDLLSSLFILLLKVRSNLFLVMSDIAKAFLMIHLNKDTDKDMFTVLWKNAKDELVAYRYRTLVFGFVSSPFVLNFVIRHHVLKYAEDEITKALLENFYVDNLIYTCNSSDALIEFSKVAFQRMAEGGFKLLSWVSNNPDAQSYFAESGIGTNHDSEFEKILGYRYCPSDDTISLALFKCERPEMVTKRTVLSIFSCVYDPLGLVLPIMTRFKIIMRDIWDKKLDWDVSLPGDIVKSFDKLLTDVANLSQLKFPRMAFNSESPCSLIIFCDAAKHAYGFTCYVYDEISHKSNLLFAKCKSSPLKTKTIPTLELLSVYLSMKCLLSMLNVLCRNLQSIFVCIDAQIVMSWILSQSVRNKKTT